MKACLYAYKTKNIFRFSRSSVNPNPGFRAQLKLWEAMKFTIDPMFLRSDLMIFLVAKLLYKSKCPSVCLSGCMYDVCISVRFNGKRDFLVP